MGLHLRLTTASDDAASSNHTGERIVYPQRRVLRSSGAGPEVWKKLVATNNSPTINLRYDPGPKDQATKIYFIQVMREFLDDVAVLPSVLAPSFAFQDADTTSDKFHVDYVSGEKDPYYNGDDKEPSGRRLDIGVQGNAASTPKVSATMNDSPNFNDASIPAGKSKMRWEFMSAAFSGAGPDQGTYYQFEAWTYEREKGKAAKLTLLPARSGIDPGPSFKAAVELWSKNHGFSLPKPAPPPPAPPPGKKVRTYTVVSGDYLSKIAEEFYGNGNLWPKIYDANRAVIGANPNLIFPGQVLVIP
jgi:nucleoid-associated protein YgaU